MKWIIAFLICINLVRADSTAVRLFWTDKDLGKIEASDLDGTNRVTLLNGLVDPRGIAIDSENDKMYWASYSSNGAIYRANCDGTGVEVLISSLNEPADLALDLENRFIYWAEEGANAIRRANLDGPLEMELILAGLNQPYYLALDGGFVYWADFRSGVIHQASLDGTGIIDFISGLGRVRDVEIADGFIYWCDRDTSDVRRRALNGSGTGTVLFSGAGLDRPHGLVLHPESGTLFWTDTATSRVDSGAMDGSGAATNVATTSLVGPWALAISQPVTSTNPYESWTQNSFTEAELHPENEASIWGESADPDQDSRSNLLEFAQGTDPNLAILPPNLVTVEVGEKVQVIFRMRADDPSLNFLIESTNDLNAITWNTNAFQEIGERQADPTDSAYEFITLERDNAQTKLFVRLRVSR